MENRSFDHLLGWLPNADGKQAGLTFADTGGNKHSTYSLSGDFTGCPHPDPDHSYSGARVEYDNGAMTVFCGRGATMSSALVITAKQTFRFTARWCETIRLAIGTLRGFFRCPPNRNSSM